MISFKVYDLGIFHREILRKSIHSLIALIPLIASYNYYLAFSILGSGVMVYTVSEIIRVCGREVAGISRITRLTARHTDSLKIEMGPITLGLGAMFALLLYPAPAATLGIYAIAFGDSAASLGGRFWKYLTERYSNKDKTWFGSFACLLTVFLVSYPMVADPLKTLFIAFTATIIEAVSAKDLDNLIIPLGTGFVAALIL